MTVPLTLWCDPHRVVIAICLSIYSGAEFKYHQPQPCIIQHIHLRVSLLNFFLSQTIFLHLRKSLIFNHNQLINSINTNLPYHQSSSNQTSYHHHHHHAPPIQRRSRSIHGIRRRSRKHYRLVLCETHPPRPALVMALWVLVLDALDLVEVYNGATEFGWATAHKKLVVCTAIQTFSFLFAVWIIFRRDMGRIWACELFIWIEVLLGLLVLTEYNRCFGYDDHNWFTRRTEPLGDFE